MSTLKRFFNLLRLDKKDVFQLLFYAIFAGLLSLSLPLGIQAIINFIQAGRISASWIVLIILVVIGVALIGILSLMQLQVSENKIRCHLQQLSAGIGQSVFRHDIHSKRNIKTLVGFLGSFASNCIWNYSLVALSSLFHFIRNSVDLSIVLHL